MKCGLGKSSEGNEEMKRGIGKSPAGKEGLGKSSAMKEGMKRGL